MTKRILWLALLLGLAGGTARGIEFYSCKAVTSAGMCTANTATGQTGVVNTAGYADVYVTIQDSNGVVNGANASEVVFWIKYSQSGAAVRWPAVGQSGILNIGSVANKPSRTFKLTRKPYSVQGQVISWGAGDPIDVIVSYE